VLVNCHADRAVTARTIGKRGARPTGSAKAWSQLRTRHGARKVSADAPTRSTTTKPMSTSRPAS